jgi:hypothetical protein
MKVLIAYMVGLFVLGASSRFAFVRRKPIWLVVGSVIVAVSYIKLSVVGV